MNFSPTMRRLSSGSVTPAKASRNVSAAFTARSRAPMWPPTVSATACGSPRRPRPPAAETHGGWFSTARRAGGGGGDLRAASAADPRQDAGVPHLRPDAEDGAIHDRGRGPTRLRPANIARERRHNRWTDCGMADLRMELQPDPAPLSVEHGGAGGVGRRRQDFESRRRRFDAIPVGHPHLVPAGRKKRIGLHHFDLGRPVLALVRAGHPAAEGLRHELHPVADAEDRQARLGDVGGQPRRAGLVDRGRTAGEDDALRVESEDFFRCGIERKQLAVNLGFSDTTGDQLAGLRTEIEDDEGVHPTYSANTIFPWSMLVMTARASIGTFSSARRCRPPSKVFSISAPIPTTEAPAARASRARPRIVWPVARKSSMIKTRSPRPRYSGETISSTVRPLVCDGARGRKI